MQSQMCLNLHFLSFQIALSLLFRHFGEKVIIMLFMLFAFIPAKSDPVR